MYYIFTPTYKVTFSVNHDQDIDQRESKGAHSHTSKLCGTQGFNDSTDFNKNLSHILSPYLNLAAKSTCCYQEDRSQDEVDTSMNGRDKKHNLVKASKLFNDNPNDVDELYLTER